MPSSPRAVRPPPLLLQLFCGFLTASSAIAADQPLKESLARGPSSNFGGVEYLGLTEGSLGKVSISESQDAKAERFCLFEMGRGKGLKLNLSTLRSEVLQIQRSSRYSYYEGKDFGVLNNGVVYYVCQPEGLTPSQVHLYQNDSSIKVVDVPNNSPIYCFGEHLAYTVLPVKGDMDYKLKVINSDGRVSTRSIKLSNNFTKKHLSGLDSNNPEKGHASLNPDRNSISFLSELSESERKTDPKGESTGMWREFDLESGDLVSNPIFITSAHASPSAAWLLRGVASKGWSVFREVSSSTGGKEASVYLQKMGSEQRIYIGRDDFSFRGRAPLKVVESEKNNCVYVISGGCLGTQIERFDLKTSKVTAIREFRWDGQTEGSEAFFFNSNHWLAVPRLGGMGFFALDVHNASVDEIASATTNSRGDFLVLLKSGIYAGSPGCELAFSNSQRGENGDLSILAPWRNRPAEVARFFGGTGPEVEALAKATERWLSKLGHPEKNTEPAVSDLPTVELADDIPLWTREENVNLALNVKQGKSSVRELVVRVNGVEQGGRQGAATGRVNCAANLAEGQNWIEVIAKDEWGRAGRALRFRTILSRAPYTPTRYIISVGVSKYADESLNLNFAAKDAADMAESLKASAGAKSQMLVLTDNQAKKDLPDKVREFLRTAKESDEVIVFCAGHGVLDSRLDYIFASHDFRPSSPSDTGVKLDDLVSSVNSCRALKRLILLDTCHAGLVGEKEEIILNRLASNRIGGVRAIRSRGLSAVPAAGLRSAEQRRFIEELFQLPGFFRGVNIIGASGGAEFAQESERLKNGVFTASIIEALDGKKADYNQDGRVRVAELRMYIAQRVPQLTQGAQRPSVIAAEPDQDFDVVKREYWRPNENLGETLGTQDDQSGLREFISSHIANLSSNDADKVIASYADKVFYCYAKGVVGKDKVKTSISSLMRDYPLREYSDVSVKKIEEVTDGSMKIFYSLKYSYSGKRGATGQTNTVLTVRKIRGEWKIVGFNEEVIRH